MKKIVRLTESDLTRIVKRVINERSLLTETVIDTTLTSSGPINIPARTICGAGNDYIMASFIVDNTQGAADAYLTQTPYMSNMGSGQPMRQSGEYNVTIGGKPVVGQADGQNSPKIPKGKKATVNVVINTNMMNILNQKRAASNPAEGIKLYQDYLALMKNLKSGSMNVRYNGELLTIPITFGGFSVSNQTACDAPIKLPKGF